MQKSSVKDFLIKVFLAVALLTGGCNKSVEPIADEGSVSETGNAMVAGKLVDVQAMASTSVITMFRYDHNPVENPDSLSIYIDTTDTDGNYEFIAIEPDTYSIEAVHLENRNRMLIFNIIVEKSDTVTLGTDTLRLPDQMLIPLPLNPNLETGYLYIPGTSIYYYLNEVTIVGDYVIVDSIPVGVKPTFFYNAQ